MRNVVKAAPGLVFAAHGAAAMELDTLLPTGIPGLGAGPVVSILNRPDPEYTSFGINLGALTLRPSLSAGVSYDSAVNGLGGTAAEYNFTPTLIAEDAPLGFGAYAAAALADTPGIPSQSTAGYTVAAGQGFVLPRETLTLAVGFAKADVTGLSLDTLALDKPVAFTTTGMLAQDSIAAGVFTFAPAFGFSQTRSDVLPEQNSSDFRQDLNVEYTPGGPARAVLRFTATQGRYRNRHADVDSDAAMAGLSDDATGIWDFRLLAGLAARFPADGGSLIAPVLEASASWMPDGLDSFSLDAVREIDDPEQVGAAGYTLTQASLTAAHEYLRNVIFTGSVKAANAGYFAYGLNETLFGARAGVTWHLNRVLALDASYEFNDRQANFLRAANEHIVNITMDWTP